MNTRNLGGTFTLTEYSAPVAERFPVWGLLALAMTGFIAILTENMPAGLLPSISRGLGISEAFAGQLVTFYAFGAVAAAIPIMAATRGWSRRTLLLLAIGGFFIFNTVTALSTNYVLTLAARFIAGVAAGLAWGLLASYARRMVRPGLQGRALAVAMVGQPVALALGVPLGSWLGLLMEWRLIFGLMSGLALFLMAWVLATVPDYPGQAVHQRRPVREIFMTPGVRPVLFVIFIWILAHNILYTYISSFLFSVGLGKQVGLILLVFGIAALFGIWLIGLFVDQRLRTLTLLSIALFIAAAAALGVGDDISSVVYVAVVFWGVTFGGASTLLQTAIADAAGEGADVAQSMLVTIWNLAVAGGGVVGGILLERAGTRSFPLVIVVLGSIGLFTVWRANVHGFKPGPRTAVH